MYDEIMNRPMFQTPQQRQGAGIMAGVAPIRGYADGGFLSEGSLAGGLARDVGSGIADIASGAYDYASGVGSDVSDYTSDAYSALQQTKDDKNEINVRDLTNIFFDPEDPIDVLTLSMSVGGVTLPAAAAIKIANTLRKAYKGISNAKIDEQIKKVQQFKAAQAKSTSGRKMSEEDLGLPKPPTPPKTPKMTAEDLAVPSAASAAKPSPGMLKRAGKKVGKGAAGILGAGALGAAGLDAFGPTNIFGLKEDPDKDFELSEEQLAMLDDLTKTSSRSMVDGGGDGGDDVEEKTGIMKLLFNTDGVGGKPGLAGNVLAKLQDPKMRYALAKAAQPSEGFVPRNFFSDVAEGQMEYELTQAKLDQLEDSEKTALMKNFETLRAMYPDSVSDSAIVNSLLKTDDAKDDFLSLYDSALKRDIPPTAEEIQKIAIAAGYKLSPAQIESFGITGQEPSARLD